MNPLRPLIDKIMQRMWDQVASGHEALPITPDSVVFLGDSITHMGHWSEIFPGVTTANRGISGDTTEGVLKRLDPIVKGKPAKVFLLIGTNDLARGKKPAVVASNVEQIVKRISTGSPDTAIYVQSVMPRAKKFIKKVGETNTLLQQVTDRTAATYVDLHPALADSTGALRIELSNDKLHLMGPGYVVWRDAIGELVKPTPVAKPAVKRTVAKKAPVKRAPVKKAAATR